MGQGALMSAPIPAERIVYVGTKGEPRWCRIKPRIQCKHIPDLPILQFLDGLKGQWATWFGGSCRSVRQAMPTGTPVKLAQAKMRQLIRRGLVDGCGCGCRGDYRLTQHGQFWVRVKSGTSAMNFYVVTMQVSKELQS